jgi:hypothetical protein
MFKQIFVAFVAMVATVNASPATMSKVVKSVINYKLYILFMADVSDLRRPNTLEISQMQSSVSINSLPVLDLAWKNVNLGRLTGIYICAEARTAPLTATKSPQKVPQDTTNASSQFPTHSIHLSSPIHLLAPTIHFTLESILKDTHVPMLSGNLPKPMLAIMLLVEQMAGRSRKGISLRRIDLSRGTEKVLAEYSSCG